MTAARPVYDRKHRNARERALATMRDGQPCGRCGRPMHAWQALDLDHHDGDPTKYRGLAHAHCNRSAGATKGNRARGLRRHATRRVQAVQVPRWQSRKW